MSVELLLVPVAMAAYAAWKAGDEVESAGTQLVRTRLRDHDLLLRSLEAVGVSAHVEEAGVVAQASELRLRFTSSGDGVAVAHLEHGTLEDARSLIRAVDERYAAFVQVALYDRVMERASRMGLSVESESVGDDNSMTVVLALSEQR